MRTRLFRTLSTMFSLLLLVTVPVQANPIKFFDVVNVIGDLQNRGQLQQLKLRANLQDPAVNTSGAAQPNTTDGSPVAVDPQQPGSVVSTTDAAAGTSLISGTEVASQQPAPNVQVFQQDNVDGTICDCGEIPGAGGFVWWPFLALIPLVCLTGVCSHHECPTCITTSSPSPSVTITQVCINCNTVPEPTSLLLFGSGIVAIGAYVRRRVSKIRANEQSDSETEV